MDVSLLPHLSDEALREEARARGLDLGDASRDDLIAAIKRHAAGRDVPVEPRAPTFPPPSASAFDAARSFFGKLRDIAKSTIERRDTQPPPSEPPRNERETEPIRTRTMANLLVDQGHFDRALPLLLELCREHPEDEELETMCRRVKQELESRGLREDALRTLRDLSGPFIALSVRESARAVVYRLDEDKLLRGRALLVAEGTPTLRVVSIERMTNARVESRHEDHTLEGLEGWRRLDTRSAARLVVSVGLADRGKFVSLLHATFTP